jgi:orotate phosphoribosyltransferase
MTSHSSEFIQFALESKVLSFGSFKTKAGRISPYFFNAGDFNDGDRLRALGQFYARALVHAGISFEMLFGPAYKGITLAVTTAIALAQMGQCVPFSYNRKEVKDHGEGGIIVGAPLKGRVVIVDDVISAGTSVRESVAMIAAAGATPCAVLIALDRMERSGDAVQIGKFSAVQDVQNEFGIPVLAIANLQDLLGFLQASSDPSLQTFLPAVEAYGAKYGIT